MNDFLLPLKAVLFFSVAHFQVYHNSLLLTVFSFPLKQIFDLHFYRKTKHKRSDILLTLKSTEAEEHELVYNKTTPIYTYWLLDSFESLKDCCDLRFSA